MINPLKGRRSSAIIGLLAAALSIGGIVAPAAPASAATVHTASAAITPFAAQGCSGDVCMYLSSPSAGKVFIQAWAYNQTFYGHFELTRNGSLISNSYNNTWSGGKVNYYQWNNVSAIVARYCVIGWLRNSNGTYKNIGSACESIE